MNQRALSCFLVAVRIKVAAANGHGADRVATKAIGKDFLLIS